MTKQEAIEANLMSLVRMVEDLNRSVTELRRCIEVQDACLVALHKRMQEVETWREGIRRSLGDA